MPVTNKYDHLDKTPMHDIEVDFEQSDSAGTLIINRHQFIPDNFISDLKSNKMASASERSGEFMLALQVPTSAIEDMWDQYGFDAMNAPIKEVRRMLERLHLDAFIATNKT